MNFILEEIKPLYAVYQTDRVLRLTPVQMQKVREIYQNEFKKPMGTCNTCFAEQLLTLILHFEKIELATIATDEQPKKKKKIEDPFKDIKIDI